MPVGVGVEAVDGQPADLVAAGAAPAGHDQRGPLVGVGQLVHGGHQCGELVVWDEPGQRTVDLWDVGPCEQHPGRDVLPAPGRGLSHEPGDQGDDGPAVADTQRSTGLLIGLRAEPAQELFGVLAVQLGEAGHLRVCLRHPGDQPAQRVAGVAHGLRSVEVGVQVQA